MSSAGPTSHMPALGSLYAIAAIESGLRHSLAQHCNAHLFTLYTYFTSSEEQEFMRARVAAFERDSRRALLVEELEDVERTARFDILFDCEVDWETLTGRLGAESFSLVTRTVLSGMENRQFFALALELAQEREYVHRCEIMADGLRPGFIREQQAMIGDATAALFDIMQEQLLSAEALRRGFLERVPTLALFHLQRAEVETMEALRRAAEIEDPFVRWVAVTRRIRDEFAFFWTARVIEFHVHLAEAEESVYGGVLLDEEDATRRCVLIPHVVAGMEAAWRGGDIARDERSERNAIEIAALLSLEAATRSTDIERAQDSARERLLLQEEHAAQTAGDLFRQWQAETAAMCDDFADLIRCALVSQRFALECVVVGSRRTILLQWADRVFRTALAATVDEEQIVRDAVEAPIDDASALFLLEAQELHSRHYHVLYPQIESVYTRVFRRALLHEEATARDFIVDVECEKGIVGLYSAFHLLWLETVTMGVTRNQLIREWERETMQMWEVWVRLGIAARHAHDLETQCVAQIVAFMPDFAERAAAPPEDDDGDDGDGAETGASSNRGVNVSERSRSGRSRKEKDPNALPETFYIGEDPFESASGGNNNSNSKSRSAVRAPVPPSVAEQQTSGIVIRYRAAPLKPRHGGDEGDGQRRPSNDHDRFSPIMEASLRGGGGARPSLAKSSHLFRGPTLAAAQGSHFIMPDSVDVTSIRATIKELARIRGGTFLYLTQFFQVVTRDALHAKYDEWLASYGDMGYWAHAIEVGLLDQLHGLDSNLHEETRKAQRRAIAYNSVDARTADRQLAAFVFDRSGRIDNNSRSSSPAEAMMTTTASRQLSSPARRQQQQQSHQRRASPSGATTSPRRKRTVIDALRESLRQPPRPSQQKRKYVPLTYHPEMMCPDPKCDYAHWSPSRLTPDEFAQLEHTMVLRTSGVEAQKSKDVLKQRHDKERGIGGGGDQSKKPQQQQRSSPHPRGASPESTALPLEKGSDPAWNIFVAANSRASHRALHLEVQQQQRRARRSPERHDAAVEGGAADASRGNSPTQGRPGSRVRFNDDQHQPPHEIPRLVPSRQGDYTEQQQQQQQQQQRKQRPGSATVSAAYASESAAAAANNSAPPSHRHRRHIAAAAALPDPSVENRALQFSDMFSGDGDLKRQISADTARPKSTAASNSLSVAEQQLLSEYAKVCRRTNAHQGATAAATSAFVAQSMRPIGLKIRPAPPSAAATARAGSSSTRRF